MDISAPGSMVEMVLVALLMVLEALEMVLDKDQQIHYPLSECGTWSHAVSSSLGARAKGGVVGAGVPLSDPIRGRGLRG